jgi:hypothetical protein
MRDASIHGGNSKTGWQQPRDCPRGVGCRRCSPRQTRGPPSSQGGTDQLAVADGETNRPLLLDSADDHLGAGIGETHRRWLRVRAAADHLGVGVGTLNKLRTYGGGPPYAKLKHTVIYDLVDLDAWAVERKVRNTSEPVGAV